VANKLRTTPIGTPVSLESLNSFSLTVADLDQYIGVYNNEKIPLKITITLVNDTLVSRATRQSAFYLEVIGKNEFKYPKRDIVLEFDPAKNELLLKQHGGYFPFIKET